MMQNTSDSCSCNDYSLLTANTQIATITTANTKLDGSGTLATVLTAGANGTIVKSVTIKATMPVTQGMIRLFIGNSTASVISLYKEIPVPTQPVLTNTPTPAPYLPTFEMVLSGGVKLLAGYKIYATSQNAESFNIIAEGLNWAYPATLPSSCCNYKQEIANTGLGTISAANTNLDGSGTIVAVFTAASNPSNGAMVKSITIKALQSTNPGMVRLYYGHGGNYKLMKEVQIPQTNQSGFDPSFKVVLDDCIYLKAGDTLGASTQLAQEFAITVEGTDWSYPIS